MKILITGICGFAGAIIARTLQEFDSGIELWGIDNFLRTGSEQNRAPLRASGVHLLHGDVRCRSDLDVIPEGSMGNRRCSQSKRVGRSERQLEQPPIAGA